MVVQNESSDVVDTRRPRNKEGKSQSRSGQILGKRKSVCISKTTSKITQQVQVHQMQTDIRS